MARHVIGLLWLLVWALIASPAYVSFETGELGARTWDAFAALVYCSLVAMWGYVAILDSDPRCENVDPLIDGGTNG